MTALARPGRTRTAGRTPLADRLDALEEAVSLARGRLDGPAVEEAARLTEKAGTRLRLGEHSTVVALAGATGSGKSTLFNALVGEEVSLPGVRRPTTATAYAAVWPDVAPDEAGPLLDWLDVARRHLRPQRDRELGGLVLLDLPDFDSTAVSHRVEVERLLELVDLLVWVVDPQKYADAALHERYLQPLVEHAPVMLVVLNQVDRLDPPSRVACLADLQQLLRKEGLGGVRLLPLSARTGEGLPELRAVLSEQVAARRTAGERLEADLRRAARGLAVSCGPAHPQPVRQQDRDTLVVALAEAAGADRVAAAVDRSHRARAATATGWPFTRWARRLRADPLRRLRLGHSDERIPDERVRTGLPGPSAVERARVDTAVRQLADSATRGLPPPWPSLARQAVAQAVEDLPELLDRTVAGTDLGPARRPRWWLLAGFGQAVLAVAALSGLVWLLVLAGLAWLRFPDLPLPHVGRVPVPTLLLLGGLLLGLLLALLSRQLAAAGGRRRARVARRRLQERVERLADERIVLPVTLEVSVQSRLCEAVERARG